MAYEGDKLAFQSPACPDMDTAFSDGMIFAVYPGANQHTGKAAEAFIHFISFYYPCQTIFLQKVKIS